MPSHDAALPTRLAPPPTGWSDPPERGGRPRRPAERDRPIAAMVFGILSLVANVLFLPSLIGILYGARSLRAGTVHRVPAIAGIVTGAVGALLSLIGIAIGLAAILVPATIEGADIADPIIESSAQSGTPFTSLVCPDAGDVRSGSTITCTGVDGAGSPIAVVVVFADADGAYTWRVAPTV